MIYLDYSATTPVDKNVLDTFVKATNNFIGNANSLHKLGMDAKKVIEASTEQIAKILNVKPTEIIYTSGASESNNAAIKGVCFKYKNRGNHIITTELEHSSILEEIAFLEENGFVVDFVKLDENGLVDINDLKDKINSNTILVSIASVNSELGIRQPIEKIGEILKEYPKVIFHSDITQSVGKDKINLSNVDLASFSAQKIYGIKGIGCLIKKEKIMLEPLIHGGKSTTVYRSGTPATALIVSLAKALRLVYDNLEENIKYVEDLSNYLKEELRKLPISINSSEFSIPHIVNVSLENIKSETMLHALEEKEIYLSTKTACANGDFSQALLAVYHNKKLASSSLRISISHLTTKEELEEFITIFKELLISLDLK